MSEPLRGSAAQAALAAWAMGAAGHPAAVALHAAALETAGSGYPRPVGSSTSARRPRRRHRDRGHRGLGASTLCSACGALRCNDGSGTCDGVQARTSVEGTPGQGNGVTSRRAAGPGQGAAGARAQVACPAESPPSLPIMFSEDFKNYALASHSKVSRRNKQGSTVVEKSDAPSDATKAPSAKQVEPAVAESSKAEAEAWPAGITSVMLRNIPNRYTPEELLEEMLQAGFEGAFDYFYLVTDFDTKRNKGYGFVNLRSAAFAEIFRKTFDRHRLTRYVSHKVLELSPAITQGFDANVIKYLKTQAERVQNPWFKPMIFVPDSEGNCCCLPLCEENLPEKLRNLVTTSGILSAKPGAETKEDTVQCASSGLAADAEGSEDSDHAAFLEAEVQRFLRTCGDEGSSATTSAGRGHVRTGKA
mmetsp:Transcript_29591/g.64339  ORF Transcript_29591/g.64339 Transcript_29591/m.64339 type:complete len:418 (+) Transcript_29591:28-1281(+)